mmetsp:Transcript_20593/g.59779  ORF Transcript_20593/g.59779 Transcript_20593/m.59779 type:complete len:200 (-) Transcript_20593:132-731(-)
MTFVSQISYLDAPAPREDGGGRSSIFRRIAGSHAARMMGSPVRGFMRIALGVGRGGGRGQRQRQRREQDHSYFLTISARSTYGTDWQHGAATSCALQDIRNEMSKLAIATADGGGLRSAAGDKKEEERRRPMRRSSSPEEEEDEEDDKDDAMTEVLAEVRASEARLVSMMVELRSAVISSSGGGSGGGGSLGNNRSCLS